MGVYSLKPGFRRILRPLANGLRRTNPDVLSYTATLFAAAAGVALYLAPGRDWLYLVVIPLVFLRLAFNALDGLVAEMQESADPAGETVNELSDRVNDVLILGGLLLGGPADERLMAGAIAATLLVSYVGILAKAVGGARRFDGPLGKADRMVLLGLACVAAYVTPRAAWPVGTTLVFDIMAWTFVVLGIVTVANRLVRAGRNRKEATHGHD